MSQHLSFPIWAVGKKLNLFCEDATDNAATNLKFDSATLNKLTVPTGKRWLVYGGSVNRDGNETLIIDYKDASDDTIIRVDSQGATTGVTTYPNTHAATSVYKSVMPLVLDEGEYINIAFGGNQGAAAWTTCVVIELALP